MKIRTRKDYYGYVIELSHNYIDLAYIVFGISGLELSIEFPSDWHEQKAGWIHAGLGLFRFAIAFPWKWTVPDNMQCSGPRFGFTFFERELHLYYGKDNTMVLGMPWAWEHVRHQVIDKCSNLHDYIAEYDNPQSYKDYRYIESHPFIYVLKSGEVQNRTATIYADEREWRWKWFQWLLYPNKIQRSIQIDFDKEVGERTDSWKGGWISCSYEILPGETPYKCLMRMQKERKF